MNKSLKRKIINFLPSTRKYNENNFKKINISFLETNKKIKEISKENEQLKVLINNLNRQIGSISKQINDINTKNCKAINQSEQNLKNYFMNEIQRRDIWPKIESEIKRKANNKPVWVIKCPAPEDKSKIRWGDWHYAKSLKKYLEKENIFVIIDTKEDWNYEEFADVVLVLRGCIFYRPDRRNKKCVYIMWNISHSDMISIEEYKLYDIVCISSQFYTNKIAKQLPNIPVIALLQCTDTEIFYPAPNTLCKHDYIFIGNSRGVARYSVIWAIKNGLKLKIWGSGWNKILANHLDCIVAPYIENDEVANIYRTSKATLNDHWQDMLDNQFINNRIFDAIACGLPVISDYCEELKNIFGDTILYYQNEEEFNNCVKELEMNYDKIKEKTIQYFDIIEKKYSFKARSIELVEIVNKYTSNNL